MEESFGTRLKHAWNALFTRDPTVYTTQYGPTYSYKPDRKRYTGDNKRTIISAIFNRFSIDAAAIDIKHVRLDENDRYKEDMKSGLNDCLSVEANIDQAGRQFRQDIFASLLDEGCIAIVPVETSTNPKESNSYDIHSMRTGRIIDWRPKHVQVEVYNDRTGRREPVLLPKKMVAIVENPFYAVMNERNSTLQRLNRKLALLDAVDEQSSSGKLDLIIQLPYQIKTPLRKQQAEDRRKNIEDQLSGSKYGIAYADSTEKITQLNRPVENNLMKQVEYLTSMLYSQLGINQSVMDCTADEKTMVNYYNNVIEPLVTAVVDAMKRAFLTKAARTQRQSIMSFRNPFKFITAMEFAEVTDKLTRNEVGSSNEMRQIIGWKPSSDPRADQLINSNISQPDVRTQNQVDVPTKEEEQIIKKEETQNGVV